MSRVSTGFFRAFPDITYLFAAAIDAGYGDDDDDDDDDDE
jgi:hypothetical protein